MGGKMLEGMMSDDRTEGERQRDWYMKHGLGGAQQPLDVGGVPQYNPGGMLRRLARESELQLAGG
jgi:hypothetical protein